MSLQTSSPLALAGAKRPLPLSCELRTEGRAGLTARRRSCWRLPTRARARLSDDTCVRSGRAYESRVQRGSGDRWGGGEGGRKEERARGGGRRGSACGRTKEAGRRDGRGWARAQTHRSSPQTTASSEGRARASQADPFALARAGAGSGEPARVDLARANVGRPREKVALEASVDLCGQAAGRARVGGVTWTERERAEEEGFAFAGCRAKKGGGG